MWKPPEAVRGHCRVIPVETLNEDLFPPSYTIFVYANSHVRQAVESLFCQFSDQVVKRNVNVFTKPPASVQKIIGLDEQCRGLSPVGVQELRDHNCVDPGSSLAFK